MGAMAGNEEGRGKKRGGEDGSGGVGATGARATPAAGGRRRRRWWDVETAAAPRVRARCFSRGRGQARVGRVLGGPPLQQPPPPPPLHPCQGGATRRGRPPPTGRICLLATGGTVAWQSGRPCSCVVSPPPPFPTTAAPPPPQLPGSRRCGRHGRDRHAGRSSDPRCGRAAKRVPFPSRRGRDGASPTAIAAATAGRDGSWRGVGIPAGGGGGGGGWRTGGGGRGGGGSLAGRRAGGEGSGPRANRCDTEPRAVAGGGATVHARQPREAPGVRPPRRCKGPGQTRKTYRYRGRHRPPGRATVTQRRPNPPTHPAVGGEAADGGFSHRGARRT